VAVKEIIAASPGPQSAFLKNSSFECLYGGALGGGKAQPLDSLVLTPFGFKPMGEIKVGSQVSNPDGSVATVIQVHPQGEKDIYRISFQDRTSCEVCADHLWLVRFAQRKLKADRRYLDTDEPVRGRLITTSELIQYLDKLDGFSVNARPITPLTKPIVFTKNYRFPQILVDPYVLGVLIGDGCLVGGNDITFTSLDQEIVDQVSAKYEVSNRADGKTYGILKSPELLQTLKDWGLFGQKSAGKFIPEPYKTASIEDRFALVQGLMDTDGYVDDRGHCSYTTVSDQLATDAQFILESLGYRIIRTTDTNTGYRDADGEFIKCQDAFTLYIQGPNCERLVRLSRKKDRCKPFNGGKENDVAGRAIVKIEFSRRAEAQCITVDHPNGLYLTNNFIVTHNSWALVFDAMGQAHLSDYRAVVFRRSYNELKDLIALANSIYPVAHPGTKFNKSERLFTFPSGATITFSYAENMEDALRWRGREIQYLGVDELSDFDWDVFEFLKTRVRYGGKHKEMKLYVRATCNPEGKSFFSVKQYFIDPAPPLTRIVDKRTGRDRVFIPARMTDNPYIDEDYKRRLSYLPAKRYKALVEGEWNVWSGEVFDLKKGIHIWSWEEFYERNGIKEEEQNGIPKNWVRMMGCDWGYAVPFCFAWVASDTKGRLYVYREYMGCSRDAQGRINFNDGLRLTYEEAASEVKSREKDEMIHYRVIDPAERAKMRGDRAQLDPWGSPIQGPTGIELFAKEGLFFLPGDNNRINGIREVHRRLHYEVDKDGNIQDYPYLIFIEEETPLLQATLLALESDPKNPEDILNDRNVSDHGYDCIRYISMARPLTTRINPKEDRWLRKKNDRMPDGDTGWAAGF